MAFKERSHQPFCFMPHAHLAEALDRRGRPQYSQHRTNALVKYRNSIADAVANLGKPEEISKVFVGFQKYLYQPGA
jgi:hypothetical protein